METTTNYGLKKPAQSDFVNVEDINYNSDILDEKLSEAEQKAEDAKVTVTHDTENEALCISLNEENFSGGGYSEDEIPDISKIKVNENTYNLKDAEARETANAALPAEDYTAEDILEKLKTVDGAGSGLDADLFKGQSVVPVANGGTGNTTGNAPSAAKLATARTVRTNLASTSAASFNGTANITPGVSGVLPIANGGTGASTASAAFKALAANYGYGGTKSMGAADFNDLTAPGFYSVIFSSGTDQSPYHTPLGNATNTSWYHVIVMTPENRIRQVAFFGYAGLSASGKCWTRYKHDSNWSDWVEIMTSDNIQYSTTDLTAGTSALANGDIYLVYE